MLPVLINPRGLILGGDEGVEEEIGPLVRSARSSDCLLGETGKGAGPSVPGMENPTTEEVGRAFEGLDEDDATLAGRSRDAHDLGTGLAGGGAWLGGSTWGVCSAAGTSGLSSLAEAVFSAFGDS